MLLMLVVSFIAVGGCVPCFGQQPKQDQSACCKHSKNCDQKPVKPSGERCLTQAVDFGSVEGVKSTLPVHMASIAVAMPVAVTPADVLPVGAVAPTEPSPHVSPPDRLALLSSLLI